MGLVENLEGLCEGLGRFGNVDIVDFDRFTIGFRRFAIRFAKVCALQSMRTWVSRSCRTNGLAYEVEAGPQQRMNGITGARPSGASA